MDMERLYVQTPQGEVLQMCFLRAEPAEVCPRLPFLVHAPQLSPAHSGINPMPIPAESTAINSRECSHVHSKQPAPESAAQLFGRLERALLRDDVGLPDLSAATLSHWEQALTQPPTDPLAATLSEALRSPAAVLRIARAIRIEKASDLLLTRTFVQLLKAAPQSAKLRESPSLAGTDSAVRPITSSSQECAPACMVASGSEPLPPPLSQLLVQLLHSGSMLRLSPCEFDSRVVAQLYTAGPFGPCAASQAALIYVSASVEAHHAQ
ncbi:MAG: hypothetical protein SGPRY_007667 [Prymnesium sp.]